MLINLLRFEKKFSCFVFLRNAELVIVFVNIAEYHVTMVRKFLELNNPSLQSRPFVSSNDRRLVWTSGFTPVSLLVQFATFEFATYILGSLPIVRVQNVHLGRGRLKGMRNIKRIKF